MQTADALTEACGVDPGVACRNVYEWTENETLADLAEWMVDKPLRIACILLVAWISTRIARRSSATRPADWWPAPRMAPSAG